MMATEQTGDGRILDYILGWMPRWRRRRIERRMEADPALRHRVEAWQASLAPLNDLCEPVMPPDDTWRGVQAKLNGKEKSSQANRMPWGWAISGTGMLALIAVLILAIPRPLYRADLQAGVAAHPLATVEADSRNDLTITDNGLPAVPAGKSLELWIIPAGGTPLSLGVLSDDKVQRRHIDTALSHATMAISIEPAGGAPGGTPTGPVIVSGELRKL